MILLYMLMGLAVQAIASSDIQRKIDGVRQERLHLLKVREVLESKLGVLGREMHRLDAALISARAALKAASKRWQKLDQKVAKLSRQQIALKAQIAKLQKHMQTEANAAWRRANRNPSWLDAWAGVPMTEIPHRQYMVKAMLDSQQQDRESWQQALLDLKVIESELISKRVVLEKLKNEKHALKVQATQRLRAKRSKVRAMRHDVALKKQRDQALRQQEKSLLRLLNGLQDDLLASDKMIKHKSIRKRKGHLSWPLKGKIVERFGTRPNMQHAKRQGVRIAPASHQAKGLAVHALAAGQVRYADWFGGFGLMMVVEYGDGIMAVYAHNDALQKQLGDWVEAREVIATAGSTGWVEKIRLYFELRDKGRAVNPKRWCR